MERGSAVYEASFLHAQDAQLATNAGTSWYRSKERKGGEHPFASYMINKKWTLEEEFNTHMMRFQQVTHIPVISVSCILTF